MIYFGGWGEEEIACVSRRRDQGFSFLHASKDNEQTSEIDEAIFTITLGV